MAPRRLSESEKQDLVGRYKAGESTAALAEVFGCSPNTVTRTVKALLPPEAYAALKASRQKTGTVTPVAAVAPEQDTPAQPESPVEALLDEDNAEAGATLALDDADDFAEDSDGGNDEEGAIEDDDSAASQSFTELVPLLGVADLSDRLPVNVQPLTEGCLPDSVYMLVDKVVELDARPLRDFPELGQLAESELDRHGLFRYANPRAAKRQCGRSQRVIKVPDSAVFERTSSYCWLAGSPVWSWMAASSPWMQRPRADQSQRCSGSITAAALPPLITPITSDSPTRKPVGSGTDRADPTWMLCRSFRFWAPRHSSSNSTVPAPRLISISRRRNNIKCQPLFVLSLPGPGEAGNRDADD